MKDSRSTLMRLVMLSVLTALVLVATMFLKLPTATGYIHLGDGIIFSAAAVFGGFTGAACGAVGSFLADILGGYPAWAPWTFAIKGVAGYIVGRLGHKKARNRQVVSMVLASAWIIAGYAVGTAFMYSPKAVPGEILANVVQTGSGVIIGTVLAPVLESAFDRWNHTP